MYPSTDCPVSSCTLNMVLGSASVTSPSTSIVSSLGIALADDGDVGGFHALASFLRLVFDLLSLVEISEAGSGDVGEVDEQVAAAVIRADEPETLRLRKPFHCASSHRALPVEHLNDAGHALTATTRTFMDPRADPRPGVYRNIGLIFGLRPV